MQFYDDLICEWGQLSGVAIVPGPRQTCRVHFPDSQVTLQIDLDRNGERILLGTNLGILNPGPYRKKVFLTALKDNSLSAHLHGVLAFSSKANALVLFQYLAMTHLSPQKLDDCLKLFLAHAKAWTLALKDGDVPITEEEPKGLTSSGMFGLRT